MELSMSHGTAGDRGIRGECPLKACPVRKYGIRMGKRKSRRRTRPQACAADSETGIPEEQRHLSQELMFFRKPASLDVGNSHKKTGRHFPQIGELIEAMKSGQQ